MKWHIWHGCEYIHRGIPIAVAHLLHETAQRSASSEYFRGGIPIAVANVFPNLFSQPFGSEYLLGNTFIAVAHLLHETAWQVKSLIVCKSLILY